MGESKQIRIPDFLAVGPPRSATTWLELILAGVGGLPAGIKETAFFTKNYELGLLLRGRRVFPLSARAADFGKKVRANLSAVLRCVGS